MSNVILFNISNFIIPKIICFLLVPTQKKSFTSAFISFTLATFCSLRCKSRLWASCQIVSRRNKVSRYFARSRRQQLWSLKTGSRSALARTVRAGLNENVQLGFESVARASQSACQGNHAVYVFFPFPSVPKSARTSTSTSTREPIRMHIVQFHFVVNFFLFPNAPGESR